MVENITIYKIYCKRSYRLTYRKIYVELDFLLNNMKSTQLDKSNYIGLKLISNLSYFSTLNQYYFKIELRYFTAEGSHLMQGLFL